MDQPVTKIQKTKDLIVAVFPILLLFYNLFSKGLFLTSRDIGLDEPFTIYHAQFTVTQILEQLSGYNNPPLYEILLHFWIGFFGISPVSVRILPLLFASFSPVALYYFGKRFFSLKTGIVAGLLLSFSTLPIYFAHDSRVYSLFLLLSTCSMYYFLAVHEAPKARPFESLLYILSSILLIYAHYFGFFILFFQVLYLLVFNRKNIRKTVVLRFLLFGLALFILYLPQIVSMLSRAGDSVSHGTWIGPPEGLDSLYYMLWMFSNFPFITVFCLLLLLSSLVKWCMVKDQQPGNTANHHLVIFWFLFAYLGMFVISFKVPMYITRYLIYALPAYYLLLNICLDYLFKKNSFNRLITVSLILCFAFTCELDPDKKQNLESPVSIIKRFKDSSTLVIVSPADFRTSIAYHYKPVFFSTVSDGREYHLLDSLMRADQFLSLDPGVVLEDSTFWHYKKIFYYGAGAESVDDSSTLLKKLNQLGIPYYDVRLRNSHRLILYLTKAKPPLR